MLGMQPAQNICLLSDKVKVTITSDDLRCVLCFLLQNAVIMPVALELWLGNNSHYETHCPPPPHSKIWVRPTWPLLLLIHWLIDQNFHYLDKLRQEQLVNQDAYSDPSQIAGWGRGKLPCYHTKLGQSRTSGLSSMQKIETKKEKKKNLTEEKEMGCVCSQGEFSRLMLVK